MNHTAICVHNLEKNFLLPHEQKRSIKDYFLSPFQRPTIEEFKALTGVSFCVARGEWVGVIGKNGSGKSTLLKVLTGIYEPDGGSIIVQGRIISFLELGTGFIPDFTVRENIFLNGTILGLTRKEIQERFDAIIKFSELGRFLDQALKNLSTGMQMRLGFSIATQVPADVYLLDEVLGVGDFEFQKKCLRVVEEMKLAKKTILFASHDIESVRKHCNRVIWLAEGKIIREGNPEEVIKAYLAS